MQIKKRVLIVGAGDVAQRAIPWLRKRFRVYALVRQQSAFASLRAQGVTPLLGDLDQALTLKRISSLAQWILHFAPPQNQGHQDKRTKHLLAHLSNVRDARPSLPRRLVYISTTGVYGDCQGRWVAETCPVNPESARAQRRVDAEIQLRQWAKRTHTRLCILRAPGIYAQDRLPLARIEQQTPVLLAEEDVYTNHIHAEDLARVACKALLIGKPQRIYNAADGSAIKMGDYFDAVARAYQYPLPPRMPRHTLKVFLSPVSYSFMQESRRIKNLRLMRELKVSLQYPSTYKFLNMQISRY